MPSSSYADQWKFRFLALAMASVTLTTPAFCYVRPPPRGMVHTTLPPNLDSSSPQQVHISLVGEDKMRVSWVTEADAPSVVLYGTSTGNYEFNATGSSATYTYLTYKSGFIHDAVIGPLKPATTYFYLCGPNDNTEYALKTPPAAFPLKFAISGDLGQTEWTQSTLEHISNSGYDVMLLPGDLSYADLLQPLWDTFGRLVEPVASQRPWMVAVGNHDVEEIPVLHSGPFTAYNARWHMPFEESNSPSNLFYSFDVAGAGIHVVVLGSYTDFEGDSAQYKWLETDLKSVDRTKTPWIIVIIHAPWYNTNEAHQGEYESVAMKASMEQLIYSARVDIVFTGHVHAYERFTRVFNDRADNCGPIHITIGDGGNREGLAKTYQDPQPSISIFREASFGHGQLVMVNGTHAQWTWHRNDDDQATVADSVWFQSLVSDPACK